MLLSRFVAGMLSVGMMVLGAGVVSGQEFPNKAIRIVTSGVGGGSDFTTRTVAQGITAPLGQPVIVDNRPTGFIPAELVAKSLPDGYTLLLVGGNLWIGPLIQNVPYDPVRDFSPITMATRAPNVMIVHPSLPVKSVKELIALAKARPGELNYAANAIGTSNHLAAELFKSMAGINIVGIIYKSFAQSLNDLLGGQVQLTFPGWVAVTPHVKAGRLRALAVTSAEPTALVPGLPTVAASGLPGYELLGVDGVFAPAKTPATIINRLNQEIVRFLHTAEAKEKFFNAGSDTVGNSPGELAAHMKSDMVRLGKVIKDAGIRAD